jgi:hypothetical protein
LAGQGGNPGRIAQTSLPMGNVSARDAVIFKKKKLKKKESK